MERKHFLLLMAVMVVGLFSVAFAQTVASLSEAEINAADAESVAAAKAKTQTPPPAPKPVPVPKAPPAPPALPKQGETLNWFKGGNAAIPVGEPFTLVDVWTGKSFKAIRTYGHNHADMEAATMADMEKMKEIWGGSWNWERRPMVAMVNGKNYAVSCAGMPHAGVEKAAAEVTVVSRSGGYGRGLNLDKIKGNGMDGHFDLHMLLSKTHGTGRVDPRHQEMIRIAAGK